MNIRQLFIGDILAKSEILGVHLEPRLNRAVIVYCIARKGPMCTQLVHQWVQHFPELQTLGVATNIDTYYDHVEWLLKNGFLTESKSENIADLGRPTVSHDLTTKGCVVALAIPNIRREHLKEFLSHPYAIDQTNGIPLDKQRSRLPFLALFRIWQEHGVANSLVDYFLHEVVRRTFSSIEPLDEEQARWLWEISAMAEIKSFHEKDARQLSRIMSQLNLSRKEVERALDVWQSDREAIEIIRTFHALRKNYTCIKCGEFLAPFARDFCGHCGTPQPPLMAKLT
jgi:hypothetical protein